MSANEWKVGGNLTAAQMNENSAEKVKEVLGYGETVMSSTDPEWDGTWVDLMNQPNPHAPECVDKRYDDMWWLYRLCDTVPDDYRIADGETVEHFTERVFTNLMDNEVYSGMFAAYQMVEGEVTGMVKSFSMKGWLPTMKTVVMEIMPTIGSFFGATTEQEVEELLLTLYEHAKENFTLEMTEDTLAADIDMGDMFVHPGGITVLYSDIDNDGTIIPAGVYIWGLNFVQIDGSGTTWQGQIMTQSIPYKENIIGIKSKFMPQSIVNDINALKLEVKKAEVFQNVMIVMDYISLFTGEIGNIQLYKDVEGAPSEETKITWEEARRLLREGIQFYLTKVGYYYELAPGEEQYYWHTVAAELETQSLSQYLNEDANIYEPLHFLCQVSTEDGLTIQTLILPYGYGKWYGEGPLSERPSATDHKGGIYKQYLNESGTQYLYYESKEDSGDAGKINWVSTGVYYNSGTYMGPNIKLENFNLSTKDICMKVWKDNQYGSQNIYKPKAEDVFAHAQKGGTVIWGDEIVSVSKSTGTYQKSETFSFKNNSSEPILPSNSNIWEDYLVVQSNGDGTYAIYHPIKFPNKNTEPTDTEYWEKVTSTDQTFSWGGYNYTFKDTGLIIPDNLVPYQYGEYPTTVGTVFLDQNRDLRLVKEGQSEYYLRHLWATCDEVILTGKPTLTDDTYGNEYLKQSKLRMEWVTTNNGSISSSSTTSVIPSFARKKFTVTIPNDATAWVDAFNIPENYSGWYNPGTELEIRTRTTEQLTVGVRWHYAYPQIIDRYVENDNGYKLVFRIDTDPNTEYVIARGTGSSFTLTSRAINT